MVHFEKKNSVDYENTLSVQPIATVYSYTMRLISGFTITSFRSIRQLRVEKLEGLSAIAGLNNSGKSNILKALNLFFNGETEPGERFSIDRDYSKFEASRRQKQKVAVSVTFSLPDFFNFRKELEPVKNLLKGTDFTIWKEWTRDSISPSVWLNDDELDVRDAYRIEQFLSLIRFRYIPNRIVPIDIIRAEGTALKDSIFRRLKVSKQENDALFDKVGRQATTFVGSFVEKYKNVIANFDSLRLSTPRSLADVIFNLSYSDLSP